jgi:Spy/CpxP family protein refolding chaperone
MRDMSGSTHGVAVARAPSNIGVDRSRSGAQIARSSAPAARSGARRPSEDEQAAERLLLRRVTEQILKDLTRSLRRELRRQKYQQRQAQRRLLEQRRLDERNTPRLKQLALALGIEPVSQTKEEHKWISAPRLMSK